MAINKELYKRYKKLKAEGKNVTLAELKAEMSDASTQSEIQQDNSYYGVHETVTHVQTIQSGGVNDIAVYGETTRTNAFEPQTLSETSYSGYTGNVSAQTQDIDNSKYISQFTPRSVFTPQITKTEPYSGNVAQVTAQNSVNEQKYCLLGHPLGHSLSEHIHNAGFKSIGIDATYELLDTPAEDLVDRIKYLKSNNYSGFNVTIPLKLPVTMFLNEVDISADIIGAVNTVLISPDKTMKGYNTDVNGFRNAIPSDFVLKGKTAGILGTGGAARAAISALATSGVKSINLYTRNIPNSIELLKFLRTKFPEVVFNSFQIEQIRDLSKIEIMVNCTPIGMQGYAADMTPVEENELVTLPDGALVYDVIYNPKKTLFIKLAQKHGYKTVNGIDMLIYQALESERIWTGMTPDFKDMKIAALENL